MHASLHKSRRENHRRVVFTQQERIYSRTHLVLTNLLITRNVLCVFPMISFVSASKNSFDFVSPQTPILIFAIQVQMSHQLCFISMNDLSRSSFFDVSLELVKNQIHQASKQHIYKFKILGRQLQWELTNDKIIDKLDTLIEEWLLVNKVNTIPLSGC